MSDLWTTASADTEAEQRNRHLTEGRIAAASAFTFVAQANSQSDLDNRLALVEDRVEKAAREVVGDLDLPAVYALKDVLVEDIRTTVASVIKQAAVVPDDVVNAVLGYWGGSVVHRGDTQGRTDIDGGAPTYTDAYTIANQHGETAILYAVEGRDYDYALSFYDGSSARIRRTPDGGLEWEGMRGDWVKIGARKQAGVYCNTHQVWVGDGNASTHEDCSKEQKATEKTKESRHKQAAEKWYVHTNSVRSDGTKDAFLTKEFDTEAEARAYADEVKDDETEVKVQGPTTASRTASKIGTLRKIVEDKQHAKVDGVDVDMQTAKAIVTVYDALKDPANKAKFETLPVSLLADFAWSQVSIQGFSSKVEQTFHRHLATWRGYTVIFSSVDGAGTVTTKDGVTPGGSSGIDDPLYFQDLDAAKAFADAEQVKADADGNPFRYTYAVFGNGGQKVYQTTASPRTGSKTAAEGNVCAVCGDKIAKDDAQEDPSTWHHDNGEKHDHEAKPADSSKESRKKAQSFEEWMSKVDAAIEKKVGLTSMDLADIGYRDLFDDGASPAEAAREALANEGFTGSIKQAGAPSKVCPDCSAPVEPIIYRYDGIDILRATCDVCGWTGHKQKKSEASMESLIAEARALLGPFEAAAPVREVEVVPGGPIGTGAMVVVKGGDVGSTYQDVLTQMKNQGLDIEDHESAGGDSDDTLIYTNVSSEQVRDALDGQSNSAGVSFKVTGSKAAAGYWVRHNPDGTTTTFETDHTGKIAMRKGAPFAGYDDFDACVQANSDKDDPQAYCGKIKHQVEDSKESSRKQAVPGPQGHTCRYCGQYLSTRYPEQAEQARAHMRAHEEAGDPLDPEMEARRQERLRHMRSSKQAEWDGTIPPAGYKPDVDFGEHYGGDTPSYMTPDGPVWMFRKGQKTRFYDIDGNQVGPEQSNVAPAMAYANAQGWDSGLFSNVFGNGMKPFSSKQAGEIPEQFKKKDEAPTEDAPAEGETTEKFKVVDAQGNTVSDGFGTEEEAQAFIDQMGQDDSDHGKDVEEEPSGDKKPFEGRRRQANEFSDDNPFADSDFGDKPERSKPESNVFERNPTSEEQAGYLPMTTRPRQRPVTQGFE